MFLIDVLQKIIHTQGMGDSIGMALLILNLVAT